MARIRHKNPATRARINAAKVAGKAAVKAVLATLPALPKHKNAATRRVVKHRLVKHKHPAPGYHVSRTNAGKGELWHAYNGARGAAFRYFKAHPTAKVAHVKLGAEKKVFARGSTVPGTKLFKVRALHGPRRLSPASKKSGSTRSAHKKRRSTGHRSRSSHHSRSSHRSGSRSSHSSGHY